MTFHRCLFCFLGNSFESRSTARVVRCWIWTFHQDMGQILLISLNTLMYHKSMKCWLAIYTGQTGIKIWGWMIYESGSLTAKCAVRNLPKTAANVFS